MWGMTERRGSVEVGKELPKSCTGVQEGKPCWTMVDEVDDGEVVVLMEGPAMMKTKGYYIRGVYKSGAVLHSR
jgi:hypothetical protein